jgi:hypothetical protein
VLVGDQIEAIEVGIKRAECVDLRSVTGARRCAAVLCIEALAPVFEVAVDLLRANEARGRVVEPVAVGAERFAVLAARAGAAGLAGEVGIEGVAEDAVVLGWGWLGLVQDGLLRASWRLFGPALSC